MEAEHELAKAIENWNKTQINNFLLQRNIKWVQYTQGISSRWDMGAAYPLSS